MYLMDEPFQGVDAVTEKAIVEILRELRTPRPDRARRPPRPAIRSRLLRLGDAAQRPRDCQRAGGGGVHARESSPDIRGHGGSLLVHSREPHPSHSRLFHCPPPINYRSPTHSNHGPAASPIAHRLRGGIMALAYNRRTHNCGELRSSHIDQTVLLAGWVANHRDHRGMVFIDLRDRFGFTQLRDSATRHRRDVFERAKNVGRESCVVARGVVAHRGEGNVSPKFKTGELPDRRSRGSRHRVRGPERIAAAALRDQRLLHRQRGTAARIALARPAPPGPPEELHRPPPRRQGAPRLLRRQRLPRTRNALPHQEHARRSAATSSSPAARSRATSSRCRKARSSSSNSS